MVLKRNQMTYSIITTFVDIALNVEERQCTGSENSHILAHIRNQDCGQNTENEFSVPHLKFGLQTFRTTSLLFGIPFVAIRTSNPWLSFLCLLHQI